MEITTEWKCLYEVHNRLEFQSDGHSIPALRYKDAEGNPTNRERKWGNEVHALTLLGPDGNPVTVRDVNTGKEYSLCRALSDTLVDADRMMSELIASTFFAQKKALDVVAFTAEQLRKCSDERTQLMNWMLSHGKAEDLEQAIGIRAAAVEDFKRQSLSPQLRADVEAKLGGGL